MKTCICVLIDQYSTGLFVKSLLCLKKNPIARKRLILKLELYHILTSWVSIIKLIMAVKGSSKTNERKPKTCLG
jgi:hypothetical protein